MHLPMLSLAIADLLCGAIAMPAYIAKKLVDGHEGEGIVCDIFRFTYFFTEYALVSSLVLVSVERMCTLKYPLKSVHPKFARKLTALLLLAWLDALLVSLLPFIPWEPNARATCTYRPTRWWSLLVIHKNVFVPLLIVILCYTYIYKIAMSHVKMIRKECQPGHSINSKITEWKQRRKATMTLFIVIGIFLLCWMPSSIYYYVQNVCPNCFESWIGQREAIFGAVVKILTFANSMTNPFIYWWRSREFRKAFRNMFIGRVFQSWMPSLKRNSRVQSQTNVTHGVEMATVCNSETEI